MAAFLQALTSEEQDLNQQLQTITALGPTAEAVAALGEFVDEYWDRTDGRMEVFVGTAAMYQAWGLQELGHSDDSIALFGRVADRFGDADDSDLLMMTIAATVERGTMMGGADGVAAAVDLLMERYSDRDDPRVRDQLATARLQQAVAFQQAGRLDEMTAVIDAMRDEFADDASEVAQAALAGAEQLLAADGEVPTGLPEHLAMLETARVHISNGNTDPGVEILDEVIDRWGDAANSEQLATAVHARLMKASVASLDDPARAMVLLEEVIDTYGDHPSVEVRRQVAAARINRGVELTKAVDAGAVEPGVARTWFEQTAAWIEDLSGDNVAVAGNPSAGQLDTQLAVAMFYAGMSALEMNDADAALGWFGRIIDRWDESFDPTLRNIVARSMLNSAAMLADVGQPEMALAALNVLLERHDSPQDDHDDHDDLVSIDAEVAEGDVADADGTAPHQFRPTDVDPGLIDPELLDVVESARAFRAELTGQSADAD